MSDIEDLQLKINKVLMPATVNFIIDQINLQIKILVKPLKN